MGKVKTWVIIFVVMLIVETACDCNKNVPLKGLQSIEGDWVSYKGVSFSENWMMKSDSLMDGIGASVSGMDTLFCEYLQLFEANHSVYYRVKHTEGNVTVDFLLDDYSKNSWMFVNAKNDFPQKIHYQLKSDTLLDITISNISNTRNQKFFMKKKNY